VIAATPKVGVKGFGITYGTSLDNSQLSGGTATYNVNGTQVSVPGTFSYTSDGGTVLNASTTAYNEAVTFTPGDTNDFNTVTNASVAVTVTPATLTVAADNKTRYYGAANPTPTYQISGFVNKESSSVVSGAPTLSISATPNSPPNDYTITVSTGNLSASNYTVSPLNGILTVQQAPLMTTTATINATAGAPFSGTVATFTTPDLVDNGKAFSATITWGDGFSSSGVVAGSNGSFTVTGSHTFADPFTGSVSVQISHNQNYTASATVTDNATVTRLNQPVVPGLTGGIGFWNNKNGQMLINSFNNSVSGGSMSTMLANWLAMTFPNLYGASAGSKNNLTNDTNAQVAAYFQGLFKLGGNQVQAQVLAVALDVYATTFSLGGSAGTAYGFKVSALGLGADSFNVGSNGAAFGVANNHALNVYELLLAANKKSGNGLLYNGDSTLQSEAAALFNALNMAGSIG
jgi:hypothetical protein